MAHDYDKDLWGDDFVGLKPDAPAAILKAQAEALYMRTEGGVHARVTSAMDGDDMILELVASTPEHILARTRRTSVLLRVKQRGDPYPADISYGSQHVAAHDADQFAAELGKALRSRSVRGAVESLLLESVQ